jgi:hypothetical protein
MNKQNNNQMTDEQFSSDLIAEFREAFSICKFHFFILISIIWINFKPIRALFQIIRAKNMVILNKPLFYRYKSQC